MEIYSRWKNGWDFLALNAVRRRASELWLDFIPQGDSLDWLSESLIKWIPQPEFYGDYGVIHYELIQKFERTYGLDSTLNLIAWLDYVYIKGGPDRVQESYWRRVIFGHGSEISKALKPDIGQKVDQLQAKLKTERVSFESRMTVRNDEIAYAEKGILAAAFPDLVEVSPIITSVESLSTLIRLIATNNHFTNAWHDIIGSPPIEQLCKLYEAGKEVIKQMPGGANPMMLGFPGTWPALLIAQRRSRSNSPAQSRARTGGK